MSSLRTFDNINDWQVIFFQFVGRLTTNVFSIEVLPRCSRFQLVCQPQFKRAENHLSAIYTIDCTVETISRWQWIFVPRKTVVAAILGFLWLRWKQKHGEKDFVASAKRFVNIASANQNCCDDNFNCYNNYMNCYHNHYSCHRNK